MPPTYKTYITIPVQGQPFISEDEIPSSDTDAILSHLHTATQSDDVSAIGVPVVIHPMFVEEHIRWAIVDRLIKSKVGVKIWAVSDPENYSINAATVLTDPRSRYGGCPHLMGTVVLEVTPTAMAKFCPDADLLRVVEMPDEMDDDEFEADSRQKGYDMSRYESCGQVFLKAAV
jgi:hypothetical protein